MYSKIDDCRMVYYDVDATLISYFPIERVKSIHYMNNGASRDVYPMLKNIDLISELRLCGMKIAVWSQSGADHAERIVILLGIQDLVDVILPKPHLYVDDKPFENQSIPRVFKEEKLV